MKFVKTNPAKAWKIYQETMPDGTVVVRTGYAEGWLSWPDSDGKFYSGKYKDGVLIKTERHIEKIDNFIFQACIKFVGSQRGRSAAIFVFQDEDGIHKYETGMQGLTEIFLAIQEGLIKIVNGYLDHTWTFKKQGSTTYLHPVIV